MEGYCDPAYTPVKDELERIIGKAPRGGGAAIAVYHRGERVVDVWGGERNEAGEPWKEDTLSLSFSTGKGIVSTLVHILVDQGLLSYDDLVADHWPEFGVKGKENITVRHLMTHAAGLYDISSMIDQMDDLYDWDNMISTIENTWPLHEPGKRHGYHGLTYGWLVGELIQRVTGKSLADVLREELADPLGLDGLYIGLPDREMNRASDLIVDDLLKVGPPKPLRWTYPIYNLLLRLVSLNYLNLDRLKEALLLHRFPEVDTLDDRFIQSCVPAANGMFTARSLARVYACLANGGSLDGATLMSQGTLDYAINQQNRGLDKVVLLPMGWRLGYHRVFCPGFNVSKAFGHFGFGGSGAWCDPVRNLSVGVTLNNGVGTPFGDARIVQLSLKVLQCAKRASSA